MPLPDFSLEKKLWRKGINLVAGADEVGRGAFAGPVVAATVVFTPELRFKIHDLGIKIADSKQLRPRQREAAAEWIKENALSWAIGETSVNLINRLGMTKATQMAFRQAITIVRSQLAVDYLLVDAFYVPYTSGIPKTNQLPIKKGDSLSFSIAAASIIAKVHRDKKMRQLSYFYPNYGWGRNKGYGTKYHREALSKNGASKHHRTSFIKGFVSSQFPEGA